MSDDSELLRRYAEENCERAFAELVQRNIGFVYAAALRQLRDADRARDVAQVVFTDLARKAKSLRRHPALLSWLFASTRYASRNVLRAEMRRQRREAEASLMQDLTATTADADWQKFRPVLDDALCALREREREAILLRFFHGRSFAEIGEALRLNESAARQCASRALEKLRTALARRGVESTSAALGLALADRLTASVPAGLPQAVSATAIAGAVESAAPLSAVIGFMLGNKLVIGIGALVVFGAIGYTWNRAGVVVSQPLPSRQIDGRGAGRAPEPAGGGATVAPSAVAAAMPPKTQATLSATGAPPPARQLTEEQIARQATRREERQAARREARRLDNLRESAERRIAPLAEKLGLTPEKREQLIQLVMDDHEAGVDFAAANARLGKDITGNPDEYWDAGALLRHQLYDDVRALLGEDGLAAFRENELAVRQNAVVEHLQRRLTPMQEPLTDQQSQQLIALLKDRNTFVVRDDIIAAARTFLSPAQLADLTVEQERQQAGVQKPEVQRVIQQNLKRAAR
jgi:RNA polymerase sigma factor (sigma-70 family)